MAVLLECPKCGKRTLHNNNRQCIVCLDESEKENFERWKASRSIEERIDDLYWCLQNMKNIDTLY